MKEIMPGIFKVNCAVTREQIKDLNSQFGLDIISEIEAALVRELQQKQRLISRKASIKKIFNNG